MNQYYLLKKWWRQFLRMHNDNFHWSFIIINVLWTYCNIWDMKLRKNACIGQKNCYFTYLWSISVCIASSRLLFTIFSYVRLGFAVKSSSILTLNRGMKLLNIVKKIIKRGLNTEINIFSYFFLLGQLLLGLPYKYLHLYW